MSTISTIETESPVATCHVMKPSEPPRMTYGRAAPATEGSSCLGTGPGRARSQGGEREHPEREEPAEVDEVCRCVECVATK